MRAVNAAYAVLSDPARRAAYDARRYLPQQPTVARASPATVYQAAIRRQVAVVAQPPTALQRRVDRIVAVVGVLLIIAIGFYTVSVIPYAEQQFQAARQSRPADQSAAIGTAQAAAREPRQVHAAGPPVPQRLRSDVGLQSFPGTVIVAPTSLPPFSSMPILRVDATGQGIARYAVYYGDLTTGGATISGLVGRASFDASLQRPPECAPDAPYCAGLVAGQPPGPPGLELFRAPDLVQDFPAFMVHRVCCNGVFWSVSWYEPKANMSYTIDLSRSVAAQYGASTAQADFASARAVAELAPQLVRLP
jgi:hypothetical protein